ncbi:MAG: hypothetical protein AAF267_05155 [Deinococcota bacterium]
MSLLCKSRSQFGSSSSWLRAFYVLIEVITRLIWEPSAGARLNHMRRVTVTLPDDLEHDLGQYLASQPTPPNLTELIQVALRDYL